MGMPGIHRGPPLNIVPSISAPRRRADDINIRTPAELRCKRIGMPDDQLTANGWASAILSKEYGVHQHDITCVRGGGSPPRTAAWP
jgi:hypothetical protein